MEFFKKLLELCGGEIDLNLRIMSADGTVTVGITPGNASNVQPLTVTGTPEELDEAFFSDAFPDYQEVKGLLTNKSSIKAEVDGTAKQKKETVPATKKATVTKEKKGEEPNLFAEEADVDGTEKEEGE